MLKFDVCTMDKRDRHRFGVLWGVNREEGILMRFHLKPGSYDFEVPAYVLETWFASAGYPVFALYRVCPRGLEPVIRPTVERDDPQLVDVKSFVQEAAQFVPDLEFHKLVDPSVYQVLLHDGKVLEGAGKRGDVVSAAGKMGIPVSVKKLRPAPPAAMNGGALKVVGQFGASASPTRLALPPASIASTPAERVPRTNGREKSRGVSPAALPAKPVRGLLPAPAEHGGKKPCACQKGTSFLEHLVEHGRGLTLVADPFKAAGDGDAQGRLHKSTGIGFYPRSGGFRVYHKASGSKIVDAPREDLARAVIAFLFLHSGVVFSVAEPKIPSPDALEAQLLAVVREDQNAFRGYEAGSSLVETPRKKGCAVYMAPSSPAAAWAKDGKTHYLWKLPDRTVHLEKMGSWWVRIAPNKGAEVKLGESYKNVSQAQRAALDYLVSRAFPGHSLGMPLEWRETATLNTYRARLLDSDLTIGQTGKGVWEIRLKLPGKALVTLEDTASTRVRAQDKALEALFISQLGSR